MITTTLNAIREHRPCCEGWRQLLAHMGKTQADDEPLPLLTILESNGLDDTLWCLRALGPEHHGWIRHYAVDCAERVKHLMPDPRIHEALRVARRRADGLATDEELRAAWHAARAAGDAARYAEWHAARAAGDAARYAAWHAARAAGDAARAAEWAAAEAAECEWQRARLVEYLNAGGRP